VFQTLNGAGTDTQSSNVSGTRSQAEYRVAGEIRRPSNVQNRRISQITSPALHDCTNITSNIMDMLSDMIHALRFNEFADLHQFLGRYIAGVDARGQHRLDRAGF